ncbi:MAG: 4'-phosphopantetheinyl transferase superfamily protein [Planctomycetota bacterium]|nr:4'-phosphopantetheinyl transferase superfamily protein [Planctomycetota bacterium]
MSAPVVVLAPLPLVLPRGRERVELQRDHARRAVRESALAISASLGELTKTADDVPLPSNGWFWSLSHSPAHVAGVVSAAPIGVDVEESREARPELVERILGHAELELFAARGEDGFLRTWTAKEALLKEFGLGLQALSCCCILRVDADSLELRFDDLRRTVHQFRFGTTLAAVCSASPERPRFVLHERPLLSRTAEPVA